MTDQPADSRAGQAAPVRSYRTRFQTGEDPISEGGLWLNGLKDGVDWTDVITKNGLAYGAVSRMGVAERRMEQGNLSSGSAAGESAPEGDYDDPTAVLSGGWGANQHAKAEVFSRNQTEDYFQEVQIRLRSTLATHRCTGYEVIWRCLTTENAYVEIVRWNGAVGDFTSLARVEGLPYGVKSGDLVEATVDGHVITAFTNGVEVLSAADDTFDTGGPGIGFNFGVGDTNVDHGFTYFEVDSF
jgi:hypothetical protein